MLLYEDVVTMIPHMVYVGYHNYLAFRLERMLLI